MVPLLFQVQKCAAANCTPKQPQATHEHHKAEGAFSTPHPPFGPNSSKCRSIQGHRKPSTNEEATESSVPKPLGFQLSLHVIQT